MQILDKHFWSFLLKYVEKGEYLPEAADLYTQLISRSLHKNIAEVFLKYKLSFDPPATYEIDLSRLQFDIAQCNLLLHS